MSMRIAILAGGSGTRFWPVGRRSRPKQFLALDGDDPTPLLELTWERVAPLAHAPPWIVAPATMRGALRRLLPTAPPEALLLEPAPRNTAAAVLLAAEAGARVAPDVPVLVVPADHHVGPLARYRVALRAMATRARKAETILTLGLTPDHAATGYGYLEMGERVGGGKTTPVYEVRRFVEKPTAARARRMLKGGRHLFNGGTFAFLPRVMLEEGRAHLPEVAEPLARAFEAWGRRSFSRALARAYDEIPSISVDYGIMERTRKVETVAAVLDWDDLGSWDAVARHRRPDAAGNRTRGPVTLVDSSGCVVDAEEGHVALLGMQDVTVVRTGDTVLVMPRGRGEDVRKVVGRLEAEGREDLLR